MESDGRQKLTNYAYFYLNIRPRTVKEVRDYLLKKAKKYNIQTDAIESVLERLIELKLINDKEFVRWYVEGKYASSKKSTFLLKQELGRLGISKNDIDDYFNDQDIDEYESSRAALRTKWKRFIHLDKKERFNKAASFLGRHGFSYDVIKKTIAEYEGDE